MSITTKKTTIALAASAALTAGLALSPMMASADANPFASAELSSGYLQLAEGNCGGKMKEEAKKADEAKCGAKMKEKAEKMKESKCGAKMKEKAEKMKEGKCGEAKCGANKKAAMEAKAKAAEAKCGANKKAEGNCGANKK